MVKEIPRRVSKRGYVVMWYDLTALEELLDSNWEFSDFERDLLKQCRSLLKQRDKLSELSRRWVPNDDNGIGGSGRWDPRTWKSCTHIVDRIIKDEF